MNQLLLLEQSHRRKIFTGQPLRLPKHLLKLHPCLLFSKLFCCLGKVFLSLCNLFPLIHHDTEKGLKVRNMLSIIAHKSSLYVAQYRPIGVSTFPLSFSEHSVQKEEK